MSPPLVWFKDPKEYHKYNPGEMKLMWDPYNLTMNRDAKVSISLWGYKENTIAPELLYIDEIEHSTTNDGVIEINPEQFRDRDNGPELRALQMGFIKINLTNPTTEVFMENSP